MSVSWKSPVEIPEMVAEMIQSMLSNMNTFVLTEENFEEFVAYNLKYEPLKMADKRVATAEDLRPLIGFEFHYGMGRS